MKTNYSTIRCNDLMMYDVSDDDNECGDVDVDDDDDNDDDDGDS